MKNYAVLIKVTLLMAVMINVSSCRDKSPDAEEPKEEETWSEITGLKAPMGITKDSEGRLWVTEGGTGNNDASLAFISLSGDRKSVLTGLPSKVDNGAIEGIGRPYIKDDALYFTHGIGGLIYKFKGNVNDLSEESLPLSESDFEVIDINAFARALPTSNDANTNAMDLYLHSNGDLFIVDSGANVIIKRSSAGELSLFAEFPKIPTPAPFPASEDAVPTGLVFDGTRFLVSALSGAPFNKDVAKIFAVSLDGEITEYKDGFTNLIQIELNQDNKPVVVQYALFSLEQPGFVASTGSISDENGNVLLSDLNQPIDLLRKEANTYYLLSYGDGTLKKVTL